MKPAGSNYRPSPAAAAAHAAATRAAHEAQNAFDRTAAEAAAPEELAAQTAKAERTNERRDVTARVMSASPLDLIVIMFDELFSLIVDIKGNIARKSPPSVEPDAERAQAIIDELINSLDFNIEMSKDLGAIYYYARDKMMEANIKFDAAIWDHIEETLRPLRDGFADAAKAVEAEFGDSATAPVGPAVIAGMTYGSKSLSEVVVNTKRGIKA